MASLKKNNRILIVDDEIDVLEFLTIYLESLGWEVTQADSTTKAFDVLDHTTFFFIITDIAMPEMDGYEFITRVREKNIQSEMACMTGFGYNPKHTLVKINTQTKLPCLYKPFNREKLAETVQAAWLAYHAKMKE